MTEFGVPPRPRHSVVGNLFLPDGGFPEFAAVAKHGNGARFRVSSCRGSQVRILAAAPLNDVQTRFRADAFRLRGSSVCFLWALGNVSVPIVLPGDWFDSALAIASLFHVEQRDFFEDEVGLLLF